MTNHFPYGILATERNEEAYKMSRKEIAMMNTILVFAYLTSERYEALSKNQSLDFMRSYKIKQ
jgi:hypothetical protein